jgi:predicted MPP superfamily phosphohydrolase
MYIFGWVSIIILLLIMMLLVIKIPKQMPESDVGKRIMALSPAILAILFVIITPKNLLYEDEALSSFIRMIIPFIGMAFSFPLILKAKKEIEKEN